MRPMTYSSLFLQSIPPILACLIEPLSSVIDSILIGQLSTDWLAALSVNVTIFSSVTWASNFIVHSANASVAKALGSRDLNAMEHQIQASVIVSIFVGVTISVCLLLLQDILLNGVMGLVPTLQKEAKNYFLFRLIGQTFLTVMTAYLGALRGLQKQGVALILVAIQCLTNIALTYFLVYILDFGLKGAAIGTTLSYFASCTLAYFLLLDYKIDINTLRGLKRRIFKQYSKNTVFLLIRSFLLTSVFFAATTYASRINTHTLAAHHIVTQVWLLVAFILDGIAVTATSVGAKLDGEGNTNAWKTLSLRCSRIGLIMGTLACLSYLLFEGVLLGLFTNDMYVLELIQPCWLIIIASQPLNGYLYVIDGILFGKQAYLTLASNMVFSLAFAATVLSAFLLESPPLVKIWVGISCVNLGRYIAAQIYLYRKFRLLIF